jgi:hypothetical protein
VGEYFWVFFTTGLLSAIGIATLGVLHLVGVIGGDTYLTTGLALGLVFVVSVWYTRFRGRR